MVLLPVRMGFFVPTKWVTSRRRLFIWNVNPLQMAIVFLLLCGF